MVCLIYFLVISDHSIDLSSDHFVSIYLFVYSYIFCEARDIEIDSDFIFS